MANWSHAVPVVFVVQAAVVFGMVRIIAKNIGYADPNHFLFLPPLYPMFGELDCLHPSRSSPQIIDHSLSECDLETSVALPVIYHCPQEDLHD